MKTALTIAGSDSSGGAGIQADIKTMTVNGVYAMSAITALTAQNTMGVAEIFTPPAEFLKSQLTSVFDDIMPDAVKTGMIPSSELIKTAAAILKEYSAKNIVIDPVMVSTSGSRLMKSGAAEVLKAELFPIAALITPNIPEAQALADISINDKDGMIAAAKKINEEYGCTVLLKGGHSRENADDLLYGNGNITWFSEKRVKNNNTHGTGCTLSSAIAANLAKGFALYDAVNTAKKYITGAIAANLDIGRGNGPINHMFRIKNNCTPEVLIK